MNDLSRLSLYLALMSAISFGGFPAVLPDIRQFVVGTNAWLTDRDFANFFALAQAIPGPNMILMMSLIGWKVAGISGAVAAAGATIGPPCGMYYLSYRLWNRLRDHRWQRIARAALVPLTGGLIVAGGTVMAEAADKNWQAIGTTAAAAALLLATRLNPLWVLGGAGVLGAFGLV